MKLGVSIKLDVTKIDKSRLFKGEKGTYLDLSTFIDTENKDQYDNNGFISQSVSKEEREAGMQGAILGNVRVFYEDKLGQAVQQTQQPAQSQNNAPQQAPQNQPTMPNPDNFVPDDDIGF